MKILDLTISDFRGFGRNRQPLDFEGGLVLFHGPNGYGKSSVAEAIEWLFYAATQRRQLGDAVSKTEYAGTYGNVHRSGPAEVSARVRMPDGREHVLTRRLALDARDEDSQLFIDGAPGSLAEIGVEPAEPACPVVAQHSLQAFIHTKPKERRDAISAALGLEEVTSFKSALDSARRSFSRTPPDQVTAARALLKGFAPALAGIPETAAVGARWNETPVRIDYREDFAAIQRAARQFAGQAPATQAELLEALRGARRQASKAVFDTARISPAAGAESAVSLLSQAAARCREALGAVAAEAALAAAATTAAYGSDILAFWEAGLHLAREDGRCPMCESPTLTARQRETLQGRVAAHKQVIQANHRLKTATAQAIGALESLERPVREATVADLLPAEWETLAGLMQDAGETLEKFRAAHRSQAESGRKLGESVRAAVEEIPRAPEALTAAIERHVEAARAYQAGWSEFARVVTERIGGSDLVGQIDSVGKALRSAGAIQVLAVYESVLDSSKALLQLTESYLQKKQTELLKQRGKEVQNLYDLLNPGAPVGFDDMEPGSDQIKLHARSFGVRMSAAANLSECQLNCLGLAVSIMKATTPGSPFGFIVLDDPVQSMDDAHCEAFLGSILPYLMDHCGKQVILLSHAGDIVDRAAALHANRRVRLYRFDKYDRNGPVVLAREAGWT
jgi:hypothetical protein